MSEERLSRRAFPSARLVPARLDRSVEVDENALREAIANRLVIPASSRMTVINTNRKKRGLKPVQKKDIEGVYFVPMRNPGAETAEQYLDVGRRKSNFWGRSDFVIRKGKAFIFKGIGMPPSTLDEEMRFQGKVKGTRGRVRIPIRYESYREEPEQRLRGGLSSSSLSYTTHWLHEIHDEYARALAEKDPVALFAQKAGIRELPIPKQVAAFEPLELPGFDTRESKRVRVPLSDMNALYLPVALARNIRLWLYTTPHPYRNAELQNPRPDQTNAVLSAFHIPGEPLVTQESLTPEQATKLATNHAIRAALLLHLVDHRLNRSLTQTVHSRTVGPGIMSVFDAKGYNNGPGVFFDFDTISPKTRKSYEDDMNLGMIQVDSTHRLLTELSGQKFTREKWNTSRSKLPIAVFKKLIDIGRHYTSTKREKT